MEFKLSEDDLMMQEAAVELATKRIYPNAEKWDEEEALPQDILDEMAELGYFGMMLPEEYGGLGLTTVSYNCAMEELAAALEQGKGSPGTDRSHSLRQEARALRERHLQSASR